MSSGTDLPATLNAFTMIELVVAMMISAIVLSIAFYAWSLLSNQLTRRQRRSAAIMEYTIFQRAIVRDMERAEAVRDSGGAFLMDMPDHRVRYMLSPDRILRDLDGVTDTFHFGAKVTGLSYAEEGIPLVGGMRLVVTLERDQVSLPLGKRYTVEQLLRSNEKQNEQ